FATYTLSLHDALPILCDHHRQSQQKVLRSRCRRRGSQAEWPLPGRRGSSKPDGGCPWPRRLRTEDNRLRSRGKRGQTHGGRSLRSEEHTSELQSRENL